MENDLFKNLADKEREVVARIMEARDMAEKMVEEARKKGVRIEEEARIQWRERLKKAETERADFVRSREREHVEHIERLRAIVASFGEKEVYELARDILGRIFPESEKR